MATGSNREEQISVKMRFSGSCIMSIIVAFELKYSSESAGIQLTDVVSTSGYDDIGVFLGLDGRQDTAVIMASDQHLVKREADPSPPPGLGSAQQGRILTGKQNSSKAGLTNLMYWVRTLSKSRPRSQMSRSTTGDNQVRTAHVGGGQLRLLQLT